MRLLALMFLFFLTGVAWSGEAESLPTTPTPAPAATEPPPKKESEPVVLQPALISVEANGGGTMSLSEKEPSKLFGGVKLGYEEARIKLDHVDFWQSKLPGAKRLALDHALLASGLAAEEPDHVVFDSRQSKLPQIAFRGLMKPREVEIIRLPLNPAEPKLVRFRVLLHGLGDFAGDLQASDGWVPYFGWAEEAELFIIGDVVPAGIANPRFSVLEFKGRAAANGVEKRSARLGRKHQDPALKKPVDKPVDNSATTATTATTAKTETEATPAKKSDAPNLEAYDWWAESRTLTLEFDDLGKVKGMKTGLDFRGQGDPSLDFPVQSPAQPAVTPPAVAPVGPKAP